MKSQPGSEQYFIDYFNSMWHGAIRAKQNIDPYVIKGDIGLLTAYLPEQEIFAVIIGGEWITFDEVTEDWFLERFERLLDK